VAGGRRAKREESRGADSPGPEESRWDAIYRIVRQIPPGKVATYGQVARLANVATPRLVGYAMAAVRPEDDVPWQRVVNARGEVSERSSGEGARRQRQALRAEGVRFRPGGRIPLDEFGWLPA
jgi:methylated-DNA-protein-cysteine methyltransferase-like protein